MIIPDGYCQINFMFTGPGVPTGAECTQAMKLVDTDTDPAVLAASIDTILTASNWYQAFSVDVTLSSILVKFGPNDTGPSALRPTSYDGGDTTGGAVPNTSMLIHKRTALGGHAGSGRMYWPGISDNRINSQGEIDDTWLSPKQGYLDSLFTDLNDLSDGLVLLHGPDSPIATPTPLLGWTVDALVATQRRRLRR